MKVDDALREGAIALAHDAAAAILAVYEHAFEVEHKSDRSPLSALLYPAISTDASKRQGAFREFVTRQDCSARLSMRNACS